MMALGKSVRLFLADGTPGGLVTAEIMNWTGHVIAAPRSDLAELLKRPEAQRTGIYLLLGDDPENPGSTLAYIGEGDAVKSRLYNHSQAEEKGGKDFWNRAIILTSKDSNVTKAHARYLESRLITIAKSAKRARLTNGTSPIELSLPEADRSDMEYFIEQTKIILPVLGVNLLRPTQVIAPEDALAATATGEHSPVFALVNATANADATAQEIDGEFIVREGSRARLEWKSAETNYKKLHEQLVADKTLTPSSDGEALVFTRDHVFASPSAASSTILGRSSNGRTEWKIQGTTTTYAQWQETPVDDAMEES